MSSLQASVGDEGQAMRRSMILLVDDDEGFRRGLAENLRDDGHEVLDFADPTEVPSLAGLDRVDLLITDYLMKGEDGLTFARRFHAARPAVPILLVTICWTPRVDGSFISLLSKPFEYDHLHQIVERLTGTSTAGSNTGAVKPKSRLGRRAARADS